MLPRRSLTATASALAVVAALGVGLLPTGATAAPESAPEATFAPTLAYVACPAGEDLPARTRCATLRVPLDWQTPNDGRTVLIAMRVTTPRRDAGKLGLTWNPGGPGGEAINAHGGIYSLLPASVRTRFDFVSFDPRGVGLSGPKLAGCEPDGVVPPATGPVDWDAYWEDVAATAGAARAACFAANPNAAPYLGTWQVVRDMEAMRVALGYDRWNFWGMSYGTRVGNTYARTFPHRLRALIEDASLMANETLARFGSTTPAGNFASVQVYASVAGKRQAFKIRAIFDYLDDTTLEVGQELPLTRWSFSTSINTALREGKYADLRVAVNALYDAITSSSSDERRRAARAAARGLQVRNGDEPIVDPVSDSFAISFVTCADLPDRPTPAQLAQMSRVVEQDYGTASGVDVGRASLCLGLPSGFSPPTSNGDSTMTLRPPPLFLLATGDAATPWIWGRSLANTFAGSRTITYNGTDHGLIVVASPCIETWIEKYLVKLQLPRRDLFCPSVA